MSTSTCNCNCKKQPQQQQLLLSTSTTSTSTSGHMVYVYIYVYKNQPHAPRIELSNHINITQHKTTQKHRYIFYYIGFFTTICINHEPLQLQQTTRTTIYRWNSVPPPRSQTSAEAAFLSRDQPERARSGMTG